MRPTPVFSLLLASTVAAAPSDRARAPEVEALRTALTLHASFDRTADADFARGDRHIYTAAERNQREAAPRGLPAAELVRIAPAAGRHGPALEFRRKVQPLVFFRGPENLGYRPADWQGAVSLWLRVAPDEDLEPGYCDPFQIYAQAWAEGNMFIEFSKDHAPRHFRFGLMPVTRYWNPQNRKYEEMPENERPIVAVHQPPFTRDRWVHVVVTFANINSGRPDGRGTLYLDGEKIGTAAGWNHTFNWDPAKSVLTLGLNYVGFLDDLAVFDRELTAEEVRMLHALPQGVASLGTPPTSTPLSP